MQEPQTSSAQPLLDNFELAALLLACIAQIAVVVMTLRDLPGDLAGDLAGGAPAATQAAVDYSVIERP